MRTPSAIACGSSTGVCSVFTLSAVYASAGGYPTIPLDSEAVDVEIGP